MIPSVVTPTTIPNNFPVILYYYASKVFTWFMTEMTELVTFILANPLVLAMFMILLCGSVVAMFFRIWHNA